MWIRSQDDHLICKCENIQIVEKCVNEVHRISHWFIYNNNYCLGEYSTEKRAIEILDQIAFRLIQQNSEYYIFTLPHN